MRHTLLILLAVALASCNSLRPDPLDPQENFPKMPSKTVVVSETIKITRANDQDYKDDVVYQAGKALGDLNSQDEDQKPVFSIEQDGVKFGPVVVYGGDGVHIRANDVKLKLISLGGEDCVTIKSGDRADITGFSHGRLKDKRIQINAGRDHYIHDYIVYGDQGKLAKLAGQKGQTLSATFKDNRAFGIIADGDGPNVTIIDGGGNQNARGRKFVLNKGASLKTK